MKDSEEIWKILKISTININGVISNAKLSQMIFQNEINIYR